jgi:hypothetical protein
MLLLLTLTLAQIPYNHTADQYVGNDSLYSTGVELADVNSDNLPDVILVNGNDMAMQKVEVYLNHGGYFSDSPDWQSEDEAYNGHLAIEDINDDGIKDIIVSEYLSETHGPGQMKYYLGKPNGFFSPIPDWVSEEKYNIFGFSLADINMDGKIDLIAPNGESYSGIEGDLKVYYNNGSGFNPTADWVSDDHGLFIMSGITDINLDDYPDVVIGGMQEYLRIYLNQNGTLETIPSITYTNIRNVLGISFFNNPEKREQDILLACNNQVNGMGGFYYLQNIEGQLCLLEVGLKSTNMSSIIFPIYNNFVITGSWFTNFNIYNTIENNWSNSWTSNSSIVAEDIAIGDINNTNTLTSIMRQGIRANTGLVYVGVNQALTGINTIKVNDIVITNSDWCEFENHHWVSIKDLQRGDLVEIEYSYCLNPDFIVSNWDPAMGSLIFLNKDKHGIKDNLPKQPNLLLITEKAQLKDIQLFDINGRQIKEPIAGIYFLHQSKNINQKVLYLPKR